jgi:transitional endoplasmic reticulum ATPase
LSSWQEKSRFLDENLRHVIGITPGYRHLIRSFHSLAALDTDYAELLSLQAEARAGLADELRTAREQIQTDGQRAPQEECSLSGKSHSANGEASWDTLIIPRSLRENLQAYCRILRDHEAYRAQGVQLPKGLLLYGPPGTGKTQCAKTLAAEGGLNFVSLSTSDCKQMRIGWSADRLAKVFKEAREKQPSLIFIDELDAVCPPCGAYHDCISQEATAQILEEIDGIHSDGQAVFVIGASNLVTGIDAAVLSRFAERIFFPLPDEGTRVALLELFLGQMRFNGERKGVIQNLARSTEGSSGRDLRAAVNQAVLNAVKRIAAPQDFALTENDFALTQERTS